MSSSAATTFSAICAASIASGRSPISRSGLIPNAGRPRSRNHTRLPQSGGVIRRHIRESSDLGSMTIGAAFSSVECVLEEKVSIAEVLPVPCPPTSSAPYFQSMGWITTSAFSARSIGYRSSGPGTCRSRR